MKSPVTPPLSTLSTLSTALSSSSFVQIGDGSYSPGDVYVECLLPRVVSQTRCAQVLKHTSNKPPHSSTISQYSSGDSTESDGDVHVIPFAEHTVVLQAQDECQSLLNGNAVSVVEDEDVKEEVVQVLGSEAELVFATRNIFRYLVLFVKNLEQFFELQLEVLDDKQTYRQLKVTNARSLARVDDTSAQLPLAFGDRIGWRYLCMDLQQLASQAFGTRHVTTTRVRIGGNCRLLRVFFQDELYADADLPAHLTFLG